jgi:hypothetical protein
MNKTAKQTLLAMTAPITISVMMCIILGLSEFRLQYCPREPCYCTNSTSTSTVVAQPLNAWSNLGFVVVAYIISYYSAQNIDDDRFFLQWAWCFASAFLGPGSFVFHAYYSRWGEALDGCSMYIFLTTIICTELYRLWRLSNCWISVIFVCLATITCTTEAYVPDGFREYVFVTLFALYLVLACWWSWNESFWISLKNRKYFFYGVICMSTAFVFWILSRYDNDALCIVQGHAWWHLLTAAVVAILFIHSCVQKKASDPKIIYEEYVKNRACGHLLAQSQRAPIVHGKVHP